jgi:hypothetical protein
MSERTLFIYLTTRIVRADCQSARFLPKYGVIGNYEELVAGIGDLLNAVSI